MTPDDVAPQTARSQSLWRSRLGVFTFFTLLSIAHTWPLASAPARLVTRNAETIGHLWSLNQMARQITRDPLHPVEGNVFYPYSHTLACLDHTFANAVLAVPLRLALDPAAVYNIILLATFALSGVFTWMLVLRLTGSSAAGLIAGCAFAFCTFRWNHLWHLHLLSTQWIPLALFTLHALIERPTWARGAAFSAATVAVAVSSWHIALVGGVGIGVAALWLLAGHGRPAGRRIAMVALAALIAGAALLPFYFPYWWIATNWGPEDRPLAMPTSIQSAHSLRVEGLLAPVPSLHAPQARWLARFGQGESRAFPGCIVLALCVAGAVMRRRSAGAPHLGGQRVRAAVWVVAAALVLLIAAAAGGYPVERLARYSPMLALGLLLLLLSLIQTRNADRNDREAAVPAIYAALAGVGALAAFGPEVVAWGHDLGRGVYRPELFKLLSVVRAPARFAVLTMLGTAVLAGIAFAGVQRRLSSRAGLVLTALTLVAINAEMAVAPLDVRRMPPRAAVHRWLTDLREPGAVIEYPRGLQDDAICGSLLHDHRLVYGLGYYSPHMRFRRILSEELSPYNISNILEYLHPRFVIVRSSLYEEPLRSEVLRRIEQQHALHPRARFGTDFIFELFDQGTGPVFVRRWPEGILRASNRFDLTGSIAGVPDGRTGLFLAEFNGQPVLSVKGAEAMDPRVYRIPIRADAVQDGENVLTIRADYRYEPQAAGRFIGRTGVASKGDVRVVSARDRATVQVNGRMLSMEKGYTLTVLDPESGGIRESRTFNTSWYEADASALAAFIGRLQTGVPVIVASEFDVSRRLTPQATAALRDLGLAADLRGRLQWSHAAIGVKGAAPGDALEATNEATAEVTLGNPAAPVVKLMDLRLIERGK